MLTHRLRRWPNFKPALGGCLVLAGIAAEQSVVTNWTHIYQFSLISTAYKCAVTYSTTQQFPTDDAYKLGKPVNASH